MTASRRNWRGPWLAAALGIGSIALGGCEEQSPVSIGEDLLPAEPVTMEIRIPWDEFASDYQVFGGYSGAGAVGSGYVANAYEGSLNARTLARFGDYPSSASVPDSTHTTRTDDDLTFIGGRLVVFFDTLAHTNDGPVTLALNSLAEAWHAPSVTWTNAIDTVGNQRAWPEPGAGAVTPLSTATWNPLLGDTVSFDLDSAQVAAWGDADDAERSARIDLTTAGERIEITNVVLRLDTRPSIHQDTVVVLTPATAAMSFVYDPAPPAPAGEVRIGGVPAWRTVLDLTVPEQLDGPAELCAVVGCPVTLRSSEISYAALVLTSQNPYPAFAPSDSVYLDARPVLSRATLPKAPLGNSLIGGNGSIVEHDVFGPGVGSLVEIPITAFARAHLAEVDPSTIPPSPTLALLSRFEPASLSFASFVGPGAPGEPFLKLIVTVGPGVELP